MIVEAHSGDSLPAVTEPSPICSYEAEYPQPGGNLAGDFFPTLIGNAWIWSDSIRASGQDGIRRIQSQAGGTLMDTLVQSSCEGTILAHTFWVRRSLTEVFWTGADQSQAPARPDSIRIRKLDTVLSCTESREGVACAGFANRIPILALSPIAHRMPRADLDSGTDPFSGGPALFFLAKDSSHFMGDVGLIERSLASNKGTACCGEAQRETLRLVSFNGVAIGNAARRTPVLAPARVDVAPLQAGNRWDYRDSASSRTSGYGLHMDRQSWGTVGIVLIRSTRSDSGQKLVFRVNGILQGHARGTTSLADTTERDSVWTDTSLQDVFCAQTPEKLRCEPSSLLLDMMLPETGRFAPADSLADTTHVLTGKIGANALRQGNPLLFNQRRGLYMRDVGLTIATWNFAYPGRFSNEIEYEIGLLTRFNGVTALP